MNGKQGIWDIWGHLTHVYHVYVYIFFSLTVIEEGNWLAVQESDMEVPEGGFDAVICLGNSFAHLPDFTGDQENHRIAIKNFHDVLKPGGLLFIDHRNYDAILDTGKAPQRNMYYNVNINSLNWKEGFALKL